MSLPGRQAHQSLLYRHDMPQRTTMLPWYHLHSNVKTFLIRPITGSSVVSYYCSLVQKRCLEATFCHCLAKTPSSLWVSLSVGGLLHTPLPHYIITDNFSEYGGGCQGVSGFSVGRQHRNYFMFCGRFRYDKDAEVSACTERMPDTCAFVPTPHKVISMQGGNSEKASHQEMYGRYFFHIPVMRQKCSA